MEEWKDIPGYEGIYQASNMGRIRSAEGKVTSNARYQVRRWKSRILKPKCPHKGRSDERVSLWKDGAQKDWLVSRLVALTWCEGFRDGLTVNHIDENYKNNAACNLEWVTLADNIRHGFREGLFKNVQAPITLVSSDGERHEFKSMGEASRFLGRFHGYVSQAIKRSNAIRDKSGKLFKEER